jgi:ABC-type lipoprotein release transport system permease subunit
MKPLDPMVFGLFGLVAITLISVSAAACVVPAWRTSRLDSMEALRAE